MPHITGYTTKECRHTSPLLGVELHGGTGPCGMKTKVLDYSTQAWQQGRWRMSPTNGEKCYERRVQQTKTVRCFNSDEHWRKWFTQTKNPVENYECYPSLIVMLDVGRVLPVYVVDSCGTDAARWAGTVSVLTWRSSMVFLHNQKKQIFSFWSDFQCLIRLADPS